jgi:hypothetical protein
MTGHVAGHNFCRELFEIVKQEVNIMFGGKDFIIKKWGNGILYGTELQVLR